MPPPFFDFLLVGSTDLLLASVGAMTWPKAFGAQMVSGRIDWATQSPCVLTLAQVESDAQWCAIPAGGVVAVLDIVLPFTLGFLRLLRWWLVGPGWSRWRLWWVNHLTGAVAR